VGGVALANKASKFKVIAQFLRIIVIASLKFNVTAFEEKLVFFADLLVQAS